VPTWRERGICLLPLFPKHPGTRTTGRAQANTHAQGTDLLEGAGTACSLRLTPVHILPAWGAGSAGYSCLSSDKQKIADN